MADAAPTASITTPRKVELLQSRLEAVEAALAQALQEKEQQEGALRQLETPTFMRCPITIERLRSPVTVADGHTFERVAIQRWLARRKTNPLTGAPLASYQLHPNLALRDAVRAWEREHGREPPPVASPRAAAAAAPRAAAAAAPSPLTYLPLASPVDSYTPTLRHHHNSDEDDDEDSNEDGTASYRSDGYLTGDSAVDDSLANDPYVVAVNNADTSNGYNSHSASVHFRTLAIERSEDGLPQLSPQSTFRWAWREHGWGAYADRTAATAPTQREVERQREADRRRREGPAAYDARVAAEAAARAATQAREQAEAEIRRAREAAEARRRRVAQERRVRIQQAPPAEHAAPMSLAMMLQTAQADRLAQQAVQRERQDPVQPSNGPHAQSAAQALQQRVAALRERQEPTNGPRAHESAIQAEQLRAAVQRSQQRAERLAQIQQQSAEQIQQATAERLAEIQRQAAERRTQQEAERRAQIALLPVRDLKAQLTMLGVDITGIDERSELQALLRERAQWALPVVPDCATQ